MHYQENLSRCGHFIIDKGARMTPNILHVYNSYSIVLQAARMKSMWYPSGHHVGFILAVGNARAIVLVV